MDAAIDQLPCVAGTLGVVLDGEGLDLLAPEGVGGFGGRMPQGGPFLSDEELERFGLWIDGLPQ